MVTRQHRHYSTEFKLQVLKAYLDGEGSLKALARRYELTHSLILFWLDKHRRGALTEEDNLEEKVRDSDAKVAALERKVGQLIMELDLLKKLAPPSALQSGGKLSIVSGPVALTSVKDAKP